MRDRDVWSDIRDRLEATGEFDSVTISDAPGDGAAAGNRVAIVAPFAGDAQGVADAGPGGPVRISERCNVTIVVRDEDPITRDATASRLLGVLVNATDGQSLAGITFTFDTAVQSWKWKPVEQPERQLEVVIKYSYELDGWGTFDVEE